VDESEKEESRPSHRAVTAALFVAAVSEAAVLPYLHSCWSDEHAMQPLPFYEGRQGSYTLDSRRVAIR